MTTSGRLTAVFSTLDEYTVHLADLEAHPMVSNILLDEPNLTIQFDYLSTV